MTRGRWRRAWCSSRTARVSRRVRSSPTCTSPSHPWPAMRSKWAMCWTTSRVFGGTPIPRGHGGAVGRNAGSGRDREGPRRGSQGSRAGHRIGTRGADLPEHGGRPRRTARSAGATFVAPADRARDPARRGEHCRDRPGHPLPQHRRRRGGARRRPQAGPRFDRPCRRIQALQASAIGSTVHVRSGSFMRERRLPPKRPCRLSGTPTPSATARRSEHRSSSIGSEPPDDVLVAVTWDPRPWIERFRRLLPDRKTVLPGESLRPARRPIRGDLGTEAREPVGAAQPAGDLFLGAGVDHLMAYNRPTCRSCASRRTT